MRARQATENHARQGRGWAARIQFARSYIHFAPVQECRVLSRITARRASFVSGLLHAAKLGSWNTRITGGNERPQTERLAFSRSAVLIAARQIGSGIREHGILHLRLMRRAGCGR